jgi:hypothetical protein
VKPARYQRLRDRVLRQVDQVLAEPVLLRFVKAGAADPDRPAIEIEAVLRVGDGTEVTVSGRNTDTAWKSAFQVQPAELHIDRARYPGLVVRVSDEVRALSRPGEPWFEVLGIDDRGSGRLVLRLGESS